MPDLTMASAIPRTSSSLTLQANLFQVFQPIGGVRARPLETEFSCAIAVRLRDETRRVSKSNFLDMLIGFWIAAMERNSCFIRTSRRAGSIGLTIPACASKLVWLKGGVLMSALGARVENPHPLAKNARRTGHPQVFFLIFAVVSLMAVATRAQEPVGIFENHVDVGTVLHPGSTWFSKIPTGSCARVATAISET